MLYQETCFEIASKRVVQVECLQIKTDSVDELLKCYDPNLSRQSHLSRILYVVCVSFRVDSRFENGFRVN